MPATATLALTTMAHGGDAVGTHEGQVVFVPLAIAGERVLVELLPGGRGYLRAKLLEVVQPSPERVEPPCPYYGRCGGCQWQHIAYPAQLAHKRRILADALARVGGVTDAPVAATVGMESPWGYRNHAQLRADRQGHLGFYGLKSHDVVPIEACLITHPLLDELLEALDVELPGLRQVSLRAGVYTGDQMVVFEGRGALPPDLEVSLPVSCVYLSDRGDLTVLAGDGYYREELQGRQFRVSAPSFFQVNTFQAERLVATLAEMLALQPGELLLDAYCGVGAFGLSLGVKGARLVGVEGSPYAIADAQHNARAILGERADDARFVEGDVSAVVPDLGDAWDAVVLDPPRAGCAPAALQAIAARRPGRIAYVSCDPATLARDVAVLRHLGYSLERVQPIDLFPHTYHIESVSLLRLR